MNTPEEQRKLMGELMNQKNEEKARLYELALNTELFPMERFSDLWKEFTVQARRRSAPMSHRVSVKEFARAVNLKHDCGGLLELTLFQFGILSNSLEAVSQDDLSIDDENYEKLLVEATSHIEWYGKKATEIRNTIEKKVDADYEMKAATILGKGTNNFKPVKAQA